MISDELKVIIDVIRGWRADSSYFLIAKRLYELINSERNTLKDTFSNYI